MADILYTPVCEPQCLSVVTQTNLRYPGAVGQVCLHKDLADQKKSRRHTLPRSGNSCVIMWRLIGPRAGNRHIRQKSLKLLNDTNVSSPQISWRYFIKSLEMLFSFYKLLCCSHKNQVWVAVTKLCLECLMWSKPAYNRLCTESKVYVICLTMACPYIC